MTVMIEQNGRDRSAALFNNCHLVEIVNAIAQVGKTTFTTRHIATKTGLADSVVRPVILRLLDSGLIERAAPPLTRSRGRAPNFLRVTASSGWAELKSLCRKLDT